MMGWAQPFTPSEARQTRADLTRELDVALHGEQTITFPVTEAKWDALIAEVAASRTCRNCPAWDGAECGGCHLTQEDKP